MHDSLERLEPIFRMKPGSLGAQDVVAMVSRHLAPHSMEVDIEAELRTDLRQLDLGGASLVYIAYGTGVVIDPDRVDDYLIHYTLAGTGALEIDGRAYRTPPGSLFITSPGAHPIKRMSADCAHLTVRLKADRVREAARAAFNMAIDTPLRFEPEVDWRAGLPQAWFNLLLHICDQASVIERLRNTDVLRDQYGGMLTQLLLGNQPSNYSGAMPRGNSGPVPWYVRKARDFIELNFRSDLAIVEIAARTGVGLRTLQSGFRRFLGLSPARFLMNMRLDCLHATLIDPTSPLTVTESMLDAGIPHLSRYAKFYHDRYGCLPSNTLKRHRLQRGLAGEGCSRTSRAWTWPVDIDARYRDFHQP